MTKIFFSVNVLMLNEVLKIKQSLLAIYIYICILFITEGFFEVAIESWPEWDLNPRPYSYIYLYYI